MLSLKNPFMKSSPATPQLPSAPASEASVKGKQLLRGRTKAKVESLQAEVDAARADLAHATQAHGGALYEEKDSTAEALAAQQAGNRVAALEAALAVAIQKDDEAQHALVEATRQAVVAADDEANAAFKLAVMELDGLLFGELKRAVEKVGVTRQVVIDRSEGGDGVGSAIRDFDLWFPVYRDRACAALVPSGRAYSKTLDEDKKPLSVWADNVSYAMKQRRKGR